ncbi:MAG: 30S ribosomal protein S6 [Aureispira sp.]
MRQYETTFIINPTLSGDEIKQTAQMYVDFIKEEGGEVLHLEDTGVQQLAYPIQKRSSGAYFFVEYNSPSGEVINKMELAFRRDDNILRYLTIKVDKHRAQYNIDKRAGRFDKKAEGENADAKTEGAKSK